MAGARLTVAGCGDAFGSGGRHQSCYLLEWEAGALLLDCGGSALTALKQAGLATSRFDTVCVSHLHGDHCAGLPFLLIDAIYVSRRTAPLTIIGPPGLAARFWTLAEAMYPTVETAARRFDLRFVEIAPGESREIGGASVSAYEARHFSGAPSLMLRFDLGGRVFAYTGDTGWTPAVIEAGRGADLYLMECYQYDMRFDMHLDYLTIAGHLDAIGARRFLLTHMSEAMLAKAGGLDIRCIAAHDGMALDF
jgi:ribonuclease BN (tRNA processing enzyme)